MVGTVNVLLGFSPLQTQPEPDAAEILLALIFILIGLAIIVGPWLLMAYVFSRIGRKFGIGSFGAYCVPVYNLVLLCRCAGISGWVAAGFFAWILNAIAPELGLVSIPIVIGTGVYLWGSIAQRLGKNFWGWGFGSALLGIPILFLAFDSSTPVETAERASEPESVTYEARFDDEPSYDYDPIPELMTVAGVRQVRFLTGEYSGRELELPDEGIVIGRDPAHSNLVLNAPEVSGQHVRLAVDAGQGGRLVITDLGSTNGTFVQQPVGHGSDWTQVHGSYSASAGVPCRVRLGNGVAELEIT